MEIQYDSNGDGWEIGAPYEFSDNGKDWRKGFLEDVDTVGDPYFSNSTTYAHIRICQTSVVAGKIYKKPVELSHGDDCSFIWTDDNGNKTRLLGTYDEPNGVIITKSYVVDIERNTFFIEGKCTNIKRMVEAEDE